LRNCQSAVALEPNRAIYWTKLGAADIRAAAREPSPASRLHWLRPALEAANRAVDLVPADPANRANRGRVLAALALAGAGDVDAALADFDAAIAGAPCNLIFRIDAAQAALECGRPARARQYLEEGRSVDPGFARFALGLGAVALKEGRLDEAIVRFEEARGLVWYCNGEGYERLPPLLGAAHLAARHAAEAERWARRGLTIEPDNAGTHCVLAGALEMEGRNAAAASEYRTVISLAPSWDWARAALRRLEKTSP
jgi:tetratricopeptide (TPR) repeat protein